MSIAVQCSMPIIWLCPLSELARVNVRELEQNLEEVSTERDSTLQQAQEFSDRLDSSESERDQLQLALENSQNLSDELQFQLDEISKRCSKFLQVCCL